MYEFWYDYIKPKYGEKTELCYMDTWSHCPHKNGRCFRTCRKKIRDFKL